ncbi:MAG TPA: DinB family protein [Candidatus Limnocylindria bacterium]|nr:DinB family protein [Candidatus Limnocylindria bacterium]
MDASAVVHYGHQHLLRALEGLAPESWTVVGVTTRWSPRELIAHLTSYERLLADVIRAVLGAGDTRTLDRMRQDAKGFNAAEVRARAELTPEQVLAEYRTANEEVVELLARLTPEQMSAKGTLPWYGAEYSLDDFIVYANYGHKREHAAQIQAFQRSRVLAAG